MTINLVFDNCDECYRSTVLLINHFVQYQKIKGDVKNEMLLFLFPFFFFKRYIFFFQFYTRLNFASISGINEFTGNNSNSINEFCSETSNSNGYFIPRTGDTISISRSFPTCRILKYASRDKPQVRSQL